MRVLYVWNWNLEMTVSLEKEKKTEKPGEKFPKHSYGKTRAKCEAEPGNRNRDTSVVGDGILTIALLVLQ